MTKRFTEFITDASRDENKDLAGEFYVMMAKEDLTSRNIRDWFEGKEYTINDTQVRKIEKIRDRIDQLFQCADGDY